MRSDSPSSCARCEPGVDPCAHRRLEPRARLDRALERCHGAVREAREARGDDGIELSGRERVERRARLRGLRLRLGRARRGSRQRRVELVDLPAELAPTRFELEQHGLCGLAREPQLAARGVVAEALARDGALALREQVFLRDDARLAERLGHARHDREAAEPRGACALEQRKRGRGVRRDDCRRAGPQCRGHGTLVAGRNVELRERDALALFGERARSRRKSFALGERALERGEPRARERERLCELVALLRRRRRARSRIGGGAPQLGAVGQRLLRGGQRRAQPRDRLEPERQPLPGAAQAVERGGRLLAPARRVGQLLLDRVPLREQRLEPLVDVTSCEPGRRAPLLALGEPAAQRVEVELRDARAQRGDLADQLLRALGRRRLQRERTQPLLDLGLHVARALRLDRDALQLQLGAVALALEPPEPRGLLDHLAPSLG